jgi:hypothetical protein
LPFLLLLPAVVNKKDLGIPAKIKRKKKKSLKFLAFNDDVNFEP